MWHYLGGRFSATFLVPTARRLSGGPTIFATVFEQWLDRHQCRRQYRETIGLSDVRDRGDEGGSAVFVQQCLNLLNENWIHRNPLYS